MSTTSSKDSTANKQRRDIDTDQDDLIIPTRAASVRNMLTRRFSGYLPAVGSSSLSSTKQRHRADSFTTTTITTATTTAADHASSHSPEKSASDKFSRLVRTRSITMPSLPQQFPLIGDKKLFGKSDSKKTLVAGDSSPETRRSSTSSNSGLRNVVSGFIRKKNTTPSLSEKSDVSESSMNDSISASGSTGMPEKKSKVRKLRRRKVALEADKRVSIMNERDNRGWDVDVLFTEAEEELKRLKSRNSLDSAMVLSPVVTAALRDVPDVKEDMLVDEVEVAADNTALAQEQDRPITVDEQPTVEALDHQQSLSTSDPIIQQDNSVSANPLEQQEEILDDAPDASEQNVEMYDNSIVDATSSIVDNVEVVEGPSKPLVIDTATMDGPHTSPLHMTASPDVETPSTPTPNPFELSRNERNRRSQLSITRTRSGRLRLSPASSVAVTALHSEPVVSIGRTSTVNDYKTEFPNQQPVIDQVTGSNVHAYADSTSTAQASYRKSRSGDLLRALAMQSSESTSEQVGRSRQTRARAYTTSAATASRPVSYADENDVAGSFRRRPQPVGRSWRIFSWFARSRDDDDHGLLSSSSPSSAASPSLPSSSSDYHRHVGSGGNSGAHTISDASFVTAFSSSNQHNGNVRRRQPARPSVRSIWPTTDGFGHPSHMLRQKINSLSSVDSSTDLKRHLLRPWSAVEPMQSITVKSTDSNHFISQLASYSETTRIATSHLGMQSTVLTSKRSIPTLLNTNNSIRAKEQRQQQPRPLSSPSLLYGEDMMSRWREISPTLFDLHQGKAGLAKQQQQQQHTRRHLATLHARLSATRLALMIAASPRSSGNATMYQYSDLYPQTTMLPNNRPGQPLDLVKQQQQSVHPLKSTVKGSGKHYGGRRSRSSLYEDTTFRHVTRPNSYHGFAISSHRLSSSVRKYTSTVEAASLRFSSMNRRRWSDLRHSSPSRYHHHQSIDTSISTVKALPNATMIPSNTIARQLLQRSSLATSSSLMPNQRDKHLPINSNSSTLRTVSNVDSNSNEHATQLITPSLADELRMLIIGSWRRGFFNANAPSTFTHHHHHHHHQQQQQQRNPSMTSPSHSGSIRYRSIRRRRPRSNLYASRPISNVSAVSYVSSNNTDRWSQSEYGTLVQMEHFEGFDGA